MPRYDASSFPIELGELLPNTLRHATVNIKETNSQFNGWYITSLPTLLTSLDVRTLGASGSFLNALSSLHNLATLILRSGQGYDWHGAPEESRESTAADPSLSSASSLTPANAVSQYYIIHYLPKSLTRFTVLGCNKEMNTGAIADLPPLLVFLSVPSFDLHNVRKLRKRLPRCFLEISAPIPLWTSNNGQRLRSRRFAWSSKVDLDSWLNDVRLHYAPLNVRFQIEFEDHGRMWNPKERMLSRNVKKLQIGVHPTPPFGGIKLTSEPLPLNLWLGCPGLTKLIVNVHHPPLKRASVSLHTFPSTLTHLELFMEDLTLDLSTSDPIPPLHYLATNGIVTAGRLDKWIISRNLKHLDAPNWAFPASVLDPCDLTGFTKLCINIRDIDDCAVVPFLQAKNIDAVTRSNMDVSISYWITGQLLTQKKPLIEEPVTWDSIRDLTQKALETLLSARVHRSKALLPERDAIGSVVTRMTGETKTNSLRITLPAGTKHAMLTDPSVQYYVGWTFESKWIATKLVRLEAAGLWNLHWLDLLPSTLLYLGISANEFFGLTLDIRLPPALRVLLMERTGAVSSRGKPKPISELPLNLSTLPSTLQHLAIANHNWKPSSAGLPLDPTAKLDSLRNLKSLLLAGTTDQFSLDFVDLLHSKSVDRIDIVAPPSDLAVYATLRSKPKVHVQIRSDAQGQEMEQFRQRIEPLWNA